MTDTGMKIIIASIIPVILIAPSVSFPADISANRTGGDEWQIKIDDCGYFADIIGVEDGYIAIEIGSYAAGSGLGAKMVKIDKDGNLVWKNKISGERDCLTSVVETEDGYVVGGYGYEENGRHTDFLLIKTDKNGNLVWEKTYGEKNVDEIVGRTIKTKDGFLMVGFRSFSNHSVWVIELDREGNEIWNKTFRIKNMEWAKGEDAVETEDGYMVAGICSYPTGPGTGVWLIKLDKDGNEIWNKTYYRGAFEINARIIEIKEGYLIGGYGDPGSYLLKVDKEGNKIWYYNYFGRFPFILDIAETPDAYVATGSTCTHAVGMDDIWLVKISKDGEKIIWSKNFGRRYQDSGEAIIVENGSYIIAGHEDFKGVIIKCSDFPAAELNITRPKENYLYFFDRELSPWDKTVVIGGITICVSIDNPGNFEINRTEFYVQKIRALGGKYPVEPRKVLYEPPYEWKMHYPAFGDILLTCGAYYGNAEAVTARERYIYMINFI